MPNERAHASLRNTRPTWTDGIWSDGPACAHRIALVSGYFNPVHVGHLRLFEEAAILAQHLIVIVNNDSQQLMKKGRVISRLADRLEIVKAFRVVDGAIPAVDADLTVQQTLEALRLALPLAHLLFANGGDCSEAQVVAEAPLCARLDIEMVFGVGGTQKADSSSRINADLEAES